MKKNPKYLTIAKFTYLERGTLSDIKDILLCWNILIGIYIRPYLTGTGAKVIDLINYTILRCIVYPIMLEHTDRNIHPAASDRDRYKSNH